MADSELNEAFERMDAAELQEALEQLCGYLASSKLNFLISIFDGDFSILEIRPTVTQSDDGVGEGDEGTGIMDVDNDFSVNSRENDYSTPVSQLEPNESSKLVDLTYSKDGFISQEEESSNNSDTEHDVPALTEQEIRELISPRQKELMDYVASELHNLTIFLCENCDKEFNIKHNTKGSCPYHPGM